MSRLGYSNGPSGFRKFLSVLGTVFGALLGAILAETVVKYLIALIDPWDEDTLFGFARMPSLICGMLIVVSLIKKKWILLIWSASIWVLSFVLAAMGVENIPEFVRAIKGENFVMIWMLYAAMLVILGAILPKLVCKSMAKKVGQAGSTLIYSDGDLMSLLGFSAFRRAGYYMLKAKLHNIIVYATQEATEETAAKSLVDINPEIPEEELQAYCNANPQVDKIVRIIRTEKSMEGNNDPVFLEEVVDALAMMPPTVRNSAGGRYMESAIAKIERTAGNIYWSAAVLALAGVWLKMVMGVSNGKPIGNLDGSVVFASIVIFLAYFSSVRQTAQKAVQGAVNEIKDVKKSKYKDIEKLFRNTDMDVPGMTNAKVTMILRAYALYSYDQEEYPAQTGSMPFATALFTTAAACEAAFVATRAASSSSSGCSGCSSCGGCGGCGGCGD